MGSLAGHILSFLPFSSREDSIFYLVLVLSVAVFIGAELVWFLRKRNDPSNLDFLKKAPQDDARLDVLWTVIPAFVLLLLCFVHGPRPSMHARGGTMKATPSRYVEKAATHPHPIDFEHGF